MKIVISNTVPLNTGDAAILRATIAILRESLGPDLDVVVYGEQVEAARRLYPDLAFRPSLDGQVSAWAGEGRRRKAAAALVLAVALLSRLPGLAGLLRLLPGGLGRSLADYRAADAVISAGGTYLVPHYRIAPKLFDFLVTLALGRPLVLFTQSLGPFRGMRQARLLRWALGRARLVLVRDERSASHLAALGVPAENVRRCADAAFALAADPATREAPALPSNRLRVAVSVRDWPHFASGSRRQGMERFLGAIAELVRDLVEERGAAVTLLSTCQGIPEYWTDDSRVAREVVARLPEAVRARVSVDDGFHGPEALRDRYGEFDLVVATRMHAAILALCAGTAVMPLAYEFKTTELAAAVGLAGVVASIDDADGIALRAAFDRALKRWLGEGGAIRARVAEQRRSAMAAGEHVRAALAGAAA